MLATMTFTTMLISRVWFGSSGKAEGVPSLADQRVKTEPKS
ncbi:hypothetical protein BSG8_32300 [Bacillus subtilis subsp. natto]|nr:hypothetical protein BSG8_32300 [Bacillus subtilis subsp. natto]BEH07305.1 hypothetical protein BSNN_33380 [Bacillus subtilis subsp. natto]